MGTPNRLPDSYSDAEMPPRPREVVRVVGPSRGFRIFVVAAIVFAVAVIVGIAIFLTGLGGRGAAPAHNAPKAPTSMWIFPLG